MISTAHDPSHNRPEPTAMPSASSPAPVPPPARPPGKHQLALMIWIAVFPTLTVLNLALAAG